MEMWDYLTNWAYKIMNSIKTLKHITGENTHTHIKRTHCDYLLDKKFTIDRVDWMENCVYGYNGEGQGGSWKPGNLYNNNNNNHDSNNTNTNHINVEICMRENY